MPKESHRNSPGIKETEQLSIAHQPEAMGALKGGADSLNCLFDKAPIR